MTENIAIILAAGVGKRLGAKIPKQFIEVLGKPIIAYTLEIFENNKNIDAIEIVCHKDYNEEIKEIVKKYNISKVKWYVNGGDTFQDSTKNGVYNLKGKINEDDNVLLHFAVSPMVSDDIIDDAIAVCNKYGNGVPVNETILCTCIKDTDYYTNTNIDRDTIVGFNGPWTFKYSLLYYLYNECEKRGILSEIEPHTTSLMFALGKTIYFSKSSNLNIKITKKEDLDLFEGYLLVQMKRAGKNADVQ